VNPASLAARSWRTEPVCREVADANPPGEPDALTLTALSNLGLALRRQNKLDEAEDVLRRALAIAPRTLGERHPETLALMTNLVGVLSVREDFGEAETLARRVLELKRDVLGESHAETVICQSALGRVLCQQGKPEGEAVFREMIRLVNAPGFESRNPPELYLGRLGECLRVVHRPTRDLAWSLEMLYDGWGKPAEAAEWRARK
jgi:tetratricopeptide (TPR) repeat protein